ncbi:hypothetical protein HD554DRAFT_2207873 [Boletus coccyginus]|nr:hypothetical protein HD554DRAFT_2207873 [Boletus coccyginus]
MHTIPNFPFGQVANRSVIRVFFPRMYGRYDSRAIPSQDLELIYDRCLRPLVRRHMQNMAAHWPASYSSAIALYRDQNGRIHEGSLDIPSHVLDAFGRQYLSKIRHLRPYFRDAYFVHEFRGWKAATVHDPRSEQDRQLALEQFTDVLVMDKIDQTNWFIDIGLEFGCPNHVVSWADSSHESLLALCLPSVPQQEIDALVNNTKGRTDKVFYIQAYTTEKTMSYQLHPGLFSPLDPKALLTTECLKDLLQKIEKMSKILFECTADGDEHRHAQEGCARLEVRVALSKALTALTTIPDGIHRHCLVPLPAKSWW